MEAVGVDRWSGMQGKGMNTGKVIGKNLSTRPYVEQASGYSFLRIKIGAKILGVKAPQDFRC